MIVALVSDLMFLSRIREAARVAAVEVKAARTPEDVAAAAGTARLVVLDLDDVRLRPLEAVAALRASEGGGALPVVGFFSHVDEAKAQAALAAGVTRAVPRSAFVRLLPDLLRGA